MTGEAEGCFEIFSDRRRGILNCAQQVERAII